MKPVPARAVTTRRLWITARGRLAWVLSVACMATLLGACGDGSPRVSSPTSPGTTSPGQTVLPSSKKIARSPERSVTTSPRLDKDVRQVIVRYTPDREAVIVEATIDSTALSQGATSFHGYFQAPFTGAGSRYWEWQSIFLMGVQEGRQLSVQNAYTKYYGCDARGPRLSNVRFTATVNRVQGMIRVVVPSRCISEQGVAIPPVPVRASVDLDPVGGYERGVPGVDGEVFTEPLHPGDVGVLRH